MLLAHIMYAQDNSDRLAPPNSRDDGGYPAGWLYKPGEALPGIAGRSQTNGPSKGTFYPYLQTWKV